MNAGVRLPTAGTIVAAFVELLSGMNISDRTASTLGALRAASYADVVLLLRQLGASGPAADSREDISTEAAMFDELDGMASLPTKTKMDQQKQALKKKRIGDCHHQVKVLRTIYDKGRP